MLKSDHLCMHVKGLGVHAEERSPLHACKGTEFHDSDGCTECVSREDAHRSGGVFTCVRAAEGDRVGPVGTLRYISRKVSLDYVIGCGASLRVRSTGIE
ncbi:hypothetical protein NDU88_000558 [Pleurodeles waltl]|uniref:Uncharacterized protein n=1 Tax=Pleurodeles waltl TaxID=8319 RepID=A0AAV7R6B3_PLEWA|nr:hypothetical protein NDU88_000558 [Pleurodeles waltl]